MNATDAPSFLDLMNSRNMNTVGGSIVVEDWNALKMMSKEFFLAAPTLEVAELDNAFKCFGLAYINFQFPDTTIGRIHCQVEGPIILKMVGEVYMKRLIELGEM